MDKVKIRFVLPVLKGAKGVRSARSGEGPVSLRRAVRRAAQRTLVMIPFRLLAGIAVFTVLASIPYAVRAQSSPEPTQISIGAPAQANLGERLTVQAVLVDSHGRPISKESIYFTAPASFLNTNDDAVLAQAVTNKDGQAVAQFVDDFSGTVTLNAEFRGDDQYAASNATTQISAAGETQVYAEHIGVVIPGFNAPPALGTMASIQSPDQGILQRFRSLWPRMNAWPIAAVLIVVWLLYLRAVRYVFRIAAPESEAGEPPADRRRSQ